MNPLLERQLRNHLAGQTVAVSGWSELLTVISAAYEEFEADQKFVRHTLEVVSQELTAANEKLRQETENRLRRLSNYFEQTLDLQQSLTFRFKKSGDRFVYSLCRGKLLAQMGYTSDQMEGRTLEDSPWEGSIRLFRPHFERAWNGEPCSFESSTANGQTTLFTGLQPLRENDAVTEVIGFTVDITENKKIERDLRDSESRLKVLLDNLQAGVVVVDEKTHEIFDINPAALRMLAE